MKRKYFGMAAGLVFVAAFVLAIWGPGNANFLESPFSSIPYILVDHSENRTEVYIHGLNDFKFTNISLRMYNENMSFERTRNDTFFLYCETTEPSFTLNVTVWNAKKEYVFNGTVQVAPPEEAPRILTLYEEKNDRTNTYTLDSSNLPWKKLMERIQ